MWNDLKELTRRGREFIFEARAKGSERQWLWQEPSEGQLRRVNRSWQVGLPWTRNVATGGSSRFKNNAVTLCKLAGTRGGRSCR